MNEQKKSHLDISITSEALFRGLFIVIGLVILYLIRDVLVVLLLSVIIAAAVSPAASYLQKKGLPRTLAVFVIYFLAFVVLAAILYFIKAWPGSDKLGVPASLSKTKLRPSFNNLIISSVLDLGECSKKEITGFFIS